MFDQHHTAEQLEWRGLARVCRRGPAHLTPSQLQEAIQAALSEQQRREAQKMAQVLNGIDSLSETVAVIQSRLHKWHTDQKQLHRPEPL